MLRVGLNGAGRIGRCLVRLLAHDPDIALVAINDIAPAPVIAKLLRHDSVFGAFPGEVALDADSLLRVAERTLRLTHVAQPAHIPWAQAQVDVVVEATGKFAHADGAAAHLRSGVARVLVSAVCPGADATVVLGVHDGVLPASTHVVSTASCTTQAAALPLALVDEWYGVAAAEVTTVHCTTGSQMTIDQPHADPRRARSALLSMIPTTTSAHRGLEAVLPALAGKLSCLAIRVPTASVSLVEIVAQTVRPVDGPDALAARLRAAAEAPRWRGRLGVTDEELVSVDFKGDARSSIVDLKLLTRPGERLLRIVAWYDNEWGYSQRIVDLLRIWKESAA